MSTSRRPAREQSLPKEQVEKLLSLRGYDLYRYVWLLYDAGWTLRSIGEAFTPPRARSTIRSWVDKGRDISTDGDIHVPSPVYVTPAVYVPVRATTPTISSADEIRLKQLAVVARRYRAGMGATHKATLANQELTALCSSLADSGVPVSAIARAMGVTYRAVFKRINNV